MGYGRGGSWCSIVFLLGYWFVVSRPILRTKSAGWRDSKSNLAIGKGCDQRLARMSLPHARHGTARLVSQQGIAALQDQAWVEQFHPQPAAIQRLDASL